MTSLLNMPKDVMDEIVKDIGCKSIFTLRKVCRSLRDYIDKTQPDIKLTGFQVRFNSEKLTFTYKIGQKLDTIVYQKHGESCLLTKEDIGLKLEVNQDFITLFFKNLKWILEFQKSVLEDFNPILRDEISGEENTPEFRRSLESLKNILMSRKTPLQVKKIFMQTKTQSEVMSILPYLDAKSMKIFHVFWRGFNYNRQLGSPQVKIEMNEIWELEHWNTIEEMKFLNLKTTESLMNFVHFPKFEINLEKILVEEMVLLKETFQKPTKMEQFQIRCRDWNKIKLESVFGEALDCGCYQIKWFFRIPNGDNRILQLTNTDSLVEFQYIEPSKIPLGAFIRD